MKHAVDNHMADMIAQRLDLGDCFASYRLEREHDIAQQQRYAGRSVRPQFAGRKCEYVGRDILAAISAVELLLMGIVAQRDPYFYPPPRRDPCCCDAFDQR